MTDVALRNQRDALAEEHAEEKRLIWACALVMVLGAAALGYHGGTAAQARWDTDRTDEITYLRSVVHGQLERCIVSAERALYEALAAEAALLEAVEYSELLAGPVGHEPAAGD